ncbi:trimethylamine methyltransferase family protein [Rhizobium sp.]
MRVLTTPDTELAGHLLRAPLAIDEQALDAIERGADRVLADIGIRFQDADTIDALRTTGAAVTGDIVRLDGPELRRLIRENAPASFTLRARNSDRDTLIGGGAPVFAPIYGAPDVLLEHGGRVKGSRALYHHLVAEAHAAPALSNTGQMICVMDDVTEPSRPLEMLLAHLKFSDKPFMGNIASPAAAAGVIALTRTALARPDALGECNLLHLLNGTPPLTYWENPLKCLRVITENGEANMISSYMMMGATGPATAAGALIQGYAEVLAGLALTQIWRPGAPVVMGILGWPFDMQKMVPGFGDPISQSIQFHAAALGRRLGIPVRADGAVTSAKVDDGQAGAEGGRILAAASASGADFVLHAAGWLEQGRCVSIEKLRRDAAAISWATLGHNEPCEPPQPLDTAIEAELLGRISAVA